jgi:hypothetical protein
VAHLTVGSFDPAAHAILVPFQDHVGWATEEALRGCEAAGIPVVRRPGCSAIDFMRSSMASDAMLAGRESILFVDSDMFFLPAEAIKVLRRPDPVVGAMYAQKGFGKLNCHLPDEIKEIKAGTIGQDYSAFACGTGFLRIKTAVLRRMIEALAMPCCTDHGGKVWPFFLPQVVQKIDGHWAYLGEDYSFCYRCRALGVPILVDTTIRCWHMGQYPYGWEEAGRPRPPERSAALTIVHAGVIRSEPNA